MRRLPTHIIKSHQVFAAAHKLLGEEYLQTLWKKSLQQIYRWGADPSLCEDTCRNPVDLLQTTLERLQEIGRDDIVEGALRVLAGPLGYEVEKKEVRSDRGSVTGEMMDVTAALGTVAGHLGEALFAARQTVWPKGDLSPSERQQISAQVDDLIRQARELKDALERGRP